ncbi:MAG: diadenosine tetraphosphate hydrolase [Rhodospirillaceae bacterium]|nr:diadenosine tetraphosphate hydrolase [Rhodospirillaceae bacterium]|tara:strand:+ start:75 stop:452 length:378 start_codon:yes stop_codon:yes gene_type:complete
MKDTDFQSPFLGNRERLLENDIGFVIYDVFPVSEGHSLIIPHRVYSNYFDSTPNEIEGLHRLVIETKELLNEKFKPDGFNVGINCGEVSGQTIPHVHIHLIPRYKGDVENPRGGVRGVIPSKRDY